jgi:hypothetical protein
MLTLHDGIQQQRRDRLLQAQKLSGQREDATPETSTSFGNTPFYRWLEGHDVVQEVRYQISGLNFLVSKQIL